MKIKNILTIVVLATIALTACTNSDEITNNLKDTPILVNTGINELTKTRAGYGNSTLPSRFALHITQDATNTSSVYNYKNVEMKNENSTWTPINLPEGTTMLWKSTTPKATVIAYTYIDEASLIYGNDYPEKTDLILVSDQSTSEGIKKADVLYYKGVNIDPANGGLLKIPFKHVGTKFILNCQFGSEVAADAKVTACTISGETGDKNTRTSLTDFKIYNATGQLQQGDMNSSATTELKAYVENNHAEFIIFTQYINSIKLTFTVTVGGATKTYTGIWTVNKLVSHNTIGTATITIGRDKVTIGDITASPWEQGNETPGGLETE